MVKDEELLDKNELSDLLKELDKGIQDYETGRIVAHDEAMKIIYDRLGL